MAVPIRLYLIENDEKGVPRASRLPDITWVSLQELLEQASAGDLGTLYAATPSGKEPVALGMVTCEPGGTIATHTGPQTAMCYVVQGQGKLTLPGGEAIDYQPNDCIVFKPGTLHGWENGDKPAAMLAFTVT
jgi:quercetin dioxygenase-like cupin family protein